MAQKVATARKMKSSQETTSLSQIATVTAKPTRDVLKFRRATCSPPPPTSLESHVLLLRHGALLMLMNNNRAKLQHDRELTMFRFYFPLFMVLLRVTRLFE